MPLTKDQAAYVVAQHVRSIARKSGREISNDLCREVLAMMLATGASTYEQGNDWLRDHVAPLADIEAVIQQALDRE